jgi:spore coat protein CotH
MIAAILTVGMVALGLVVNNKTAGQHKDPSQKEDLPASEVFQDDRALRYYVTISEADLQHLEEHGNDEAWVPVHLSVSGENFETVDLGQVGIRHKGAWSLHHCWDLYGGTRNDHGIWGECAKLPYKFKFNKYKKETRFHGLKKLNFQANGDYSVQRELLAYSLFKDAGIMTPRIAPAMLYINGRLVGLFLAAEEIDGRFTKARYPKSGNGNLYKEAWPNADLQPDYYTSHLKTNKKAPDISDILAFARAISETSADTFAQDMAPFFDVEQILHYIAVDRFLQNFDGIMGFYSPYMPHNFYLYHNDAPGSRFQFIPWDLNAVLLGYDPYIGPQQPDSAPHPLPNWNVKPASCNPVPITQTFGETKLKHILTPPGCDKFLQLLAQTQWDRFVKIGKELLAGTLRYEAMEAKLNRWEKVLEPLVIADPAMDVTAWKAEVEKLRGILRAAPAKFQAFLDEGYIIQAPLK